MISVGSVFRGPELKHSRIDRDLSAASQAVAALRGSLPEGKTPWVNVVFVVEGSLGKPDSRHLEYGAYSRRTKGLVVQIPVPKHIVTRDEHTDFIVDALHGANAMAFEFFRQKGEEFPLSEAEDLVNAVRERLWKP